MAARVEVTCCSCSRDMLVVIVVVMGVSCWFFVVRIGWKPKNEHSVVK